MHTLYLFTQSTITIPTNALVKYPLQIFSLPRHLWKKSYLHIIYKMTKAIMSHDSPNSHIQSQESKLVLQTFKATLMTQPHCKRWHSLAPSQVKSGTRTHIYFLRTSHTSLKLNALITRTIPVKYPPLHTQVRGANFSKLVTLIS